ncbi:amidohydrolase family protein [Plantactinospora sp. CA-290183]|uniref:amidohydrolase family protein n=1 Tax=Plantactinospora sp. CA-290183 TaxID=3240006 RepID=UPI003D911F02
MANSARIAATKIGRRALLRAPAAMSGALGIATEAPRATRAAAQVGPGEDLVLINGRVHTLDAGQSIAQEMRISGGRVVAVGRRVDRSHATVFDLDGRAAYPGLIDNHVHMLRLAFLPGYTVRGLERTFTVSAACAAITRQARQAPPGSLLTLLGAVARRQFVERRFPTRSELDRAAPNHLVYLSESGSGPGQTNSACRQHLRRLGVAVADSGEVPAGPLTDLAYSKLSGHNTPDHACRQLLDEASYAQRLGLTTVMDMSGTVPGLGYLDPVTGYEPYLTLVRQQRLSLRTRIFLPGRDDDLELGSLRDVLDNHWREVNIDSDLHRVVGVGEWACGRQAFKDLTGPVNRAATAEIARRIGDQPEDGWIYHQHAISADEIRQTLDLWDEVNRTYPLRGRRWSLGHLDGIDPTLIRRANRLGIGLGVHPWQYLTGDSLPPARTILDTATVPVGGGSDGARISCLSPWSMIYALVTGRNSAGEMVNPGQTISRLEALTLYAGPQQGFFSREEGRLGGLQVGGYGDLIVPSADVLDATETPDPRIRDIYSDLTVIGGSVVHDTGTIRRW